eukprot:TRINITY_DN3502_c0_g1_i1.p1 TRINITY_DN3502_c0_g1~~TRINITY_DN3502_c0_g1_i1.p1  ORF type:complete len:274 (-),score=36.33 TRINITY_DN3502_c0_g1_i1:577-1398(-)
MVSLSNDEGTVHFVLVHGACHGAWCWYKLFHLLRGAGHLVTALDLTGAGISPVDPNTVTTFEHYDRPLMDALSQIPLSHKIVLVGHSAGGLSLTHAIHELGRRISVAVYLSATMLPRGFVTEEDFKQGSPCLPDSVYKFFYCNGTDGVPTSQIFSSEFQQEILYQLSPSEDATLALLTLRAAPIMAIKAAKFEGKSEEFMQVPRVFIKTLQDRVLAVDLQEGMIKAWPPNKVLTLDTDHSSFFSAPLQLSSCLLEIAEEFVGSKKTAQIDHMQ